ncbi:MAG: serine/threonine protein kinase [Deltaproteobacteria bacterium]|nr:serine/threonine protein kinase [Deltaproteobacteria bacterium]
MAEEEDADADEPVWLDDDTFARLSEAERETYLRSHGVDYDRFIVRGEPILDGDPVPGWQLVLELGRVDAKMRRVNGPEFSLFLFEERYRIFEKLGTGGMGVVIRGHDTLLDRPVAIKFFKDDDGSAELEEWIEEARLLAKIKRSDHVVQVFDASRGDFGSFMTMELVPGRNAVVWYHEAERSWREVVELFLVAGRGLVAIHAENIEHHDFKASNILVGDDGVVRVADFGLARLVDVAAKLRAGTRVYAAPESFEGNSDLRSDQYSFCASLWEMLYGCPPYADASATTEKLREAWRRREVRITQPKPGTPRQLEVILAKGLSVEPGERYGSMVELLRELESVLDAEDHRQQRWRRWGWRGLMGGLLVGWTMLFTTVLPALTDATVPESDRREALELVKVVVPSIVAVVAAQEGDADMAISALESAYDHGRGRSEAANLAQMATLVARALDSHGHRIAAKTAWAYTAVLHREAGNLELERAALLEGSQGPLGSANP